MFFRKKRSGNRTYLQLVENRWENNTSKQRVIATIGRLDRLLESGALHSMMRSGAKFCNTSFNYLFGMDDNASSRQTSEGEPLCGDQLDRSREAGGFPYTGRSSTGQGE